MRLACFMMESATVSCVCFLSSPRIGRLFVYLEALIPLKLCTSSPCFLLLVYFLLVCLLEQPPSLLTTYCTPYFLSSSWINLLCVCLLAQPVPCRLLAQPAPRLPHGSTCSVSASWLNRLPVYFLARTVPCLSSWYIHCLPFWHRLIFVCLLAQTDPCLPLGTE
jgi:hypothetical protein